MFLHSEILDVAEKAFGHHVAENLGVWTIL